MKKITQSQVKAGGSPELITSKSLKILKMLGLAVLCLVIVSVGCADTGAPIDSKAKIAVGTKIKHATHDVTLTVTNFDNDVYTIGIRINGTQQIYVQMSEKEIASGIIKVRDWQVKP